MSAAPCGVAQGSRLATWAPIILVAGVVMLAFGGIVSLLAFSTGDVRVTREDYSYYLFVRARDPEVGADLWVPVPTFPELRDRVSVDQTWPFPNATAAQSFLDTPYGTMFRFVFSASFGAWGSIDVAPGLANGSLTFESQISNNVWIYLANITSGNEVSIILYYEIAQVSGSVARSLACDRMIFAGTSDPRNSFDAGRALPAGYLGGVVQDNDAYTVLSTGWNLYRLKYGGFSSCGT